jgi:hypothetical protein
MKTKHVIIGCSVLLVLGIITIATVGFFFYRFVLDQMASDTPGGSKGPGTPAVVSGQGLLVKSVYLKDNRLGRVTDIAMGLLDPKPGMKTVLLVGEGGALVTREGIATGEFSKFSSSVDRVNIIDVEGDGVCEFMNRGSWSCDASLLNHDGTVRWSYGGSDGVDDMAAGDMNGDGKLEFVVGFNGGGGVHLVSTDGKKIWREDDGNVWHVEIVDANKDGKPDVVHSNAAGQITVRDDTGKVQSAKSPAEYFSNFSLSHWPGRSDSQHALLAGSGTIWLFGFDGSTAAKLSAPKCNDLWDAYGVPVKLRSNAKAYFAVIVDSARDGGSVLYLYDPRESLVYQEILPSGSCVAAIPGRAGTDRLFVGGNGIVWSYTAK